MCVCRAAKENDTEQLVQIQSALQNIVHPLRRQLSCASVKATQKRGQKKAREVVSAAGRTSRRSVKKAVVKVPRRQSAVKSSKTTATTTSSNSTTSSGGDVFIAKPGRAAEHTSMIDLRESRPSLIKKIHDLSNFF